MVGLHRTGSDYKLHDAFYILSLVSDIHPNSSEIAELWQFGLIKDYDYGGC